MAFYLQERLKVDLILKLQCCRGSSVNDYSKKKWDISREHFGFPVIESFVLRNWDMSVKSLGTLLTLKKMAYKCEALKGPCNDCYT